MKYLQAFLDEPTPKKKSGDTYRKLPTKPTKPPSDPGFVSFVSNSPGARPENSSPPDPPGTSSSDDYPSNKGGCTSTLLGYLDPPEIRTGPRQSTDKTDETPSERGCPSCPEIRTDLGQTTDKTDETPSPSAWRHVLECWPNGFRQEWADLAEVHQAEGKSWRLAEWLAFREIAHPDDVERVVAGEIEPPDPDSWATGPRWREEVCYVPVPPWDTGIVPSPELTDADRPDGSVAWGMTSKGKLVELPRTPGVDRKDPVVKVTAEGWPAWFPVRPSDKTIRYERAKPKPREKKSPAKQEITL